MDHIEKNKQSFVEEISNALTHGIGLLLSIVGLLVLLVLASRSGNVWRVVSFSIYGATLVVLFTVSTLYHSFAPGRTKDIFRIFDHSAIYILIAGSYTPFALVTLRGPWGWTLFAIIWALAAGGVLFKVFFTGKYLIFSTITYLLMGWFSAVALYPVINKIPLHGLLWLLAGGLCYSLGTILHFLSKLKFMHMTWHIFVIAGSICHYFAILFYVLPMKEL